MQSIYRTPSFCSLMVALSICTIAGCVGHTPRRQTTPVPLSRFGYDGTNVDASFVGSDNPMNTISPSDATVATNAPTNPSISSAPQPEGTPQPEVVPQDLPYGTPVPGKPGFVTSPHSPSAGYVDVRGFPPGTEVKDPYSGKTFLVP